MVPMTANMPCSRRISCPCWSTSDLRWENIEFSRCCAEKSQGGRSLQCGFVSSHLIRRTLHVKHPVVFVSRHPESSKPLACSLLLTSLHTLDSLGTILATRHLLLCRKKTLLVFYPLRDMTYFCGLLEEVLKTETGATFMPRLQDYHTWGPSLII